VLERARAGIRSRVAALADDRYLHTDLQQAIQHVACGELIAAAADIDLPGCVAFDRST
jgi:hypothetical protein